MQVAFFVPPAATPVADGPASADPSAATGGQPTDSFASLLDASSEAPAATGVSVSPKPVVDEPEEEPTDEFDDPAVASAAAIMVGAMAAPLVVALPPAPVREAEIDLMDATSTQASAIGQTVPCEDAGTRATLPETSSEVIQPNTQPALAHPETSGPLPNARAKHAVNGATSQELTAAAETSAGAGKVDESAVSAPAPLVVLNAASTSTAASSPKPATRTSFTRNSSPTSGTIPTATQPGAADGTGTSISPAAVPQQTAAIPSAPAIPVVPVAPKTIAASVPSQEPESFASGEDANAATVSPLTQAPVSREPKAAAAFSNVPLRQSAETTPNADQVVAREGSTRPTTVTNTRTLPATAGLRVSVDRGEPAVTTANAAQVNPLEVDARTPSSISPVVAIPTLAQMLFDRVAAKVPVGPTNFGTPAVAGVSDLPVAATNTPSTPAPVRSESPVASAPSIAMQVEANAPAVVPVSVPLPRGRAATVSARQQGTDAAGSHRAIAEPVAPIGAPGGPATEPVVVTPAAALATAALPATAVPTDSAPKSLQAQTTPEAPLPGTRAPGAANDASTRTATAPAIESGPAIDPAPVGHDDDEVPQARAASRENLAAARGRNAPNARSGNTTGARQNFLSVDPQGVGDSGRRFGMTVAKEAQTMSAHATVLPTSADTPLDTTEPVAAALPSATSTASAQGRLAHEPVEVRSTAAAAVRETIEAAERAQQSGRNQLDLRLQTSNDETLRVHLRWHDGVVHAKFVSQTTELQQALSREWDHQAPRMADKGIKFGETSFEQRDQSSGQSSSQNAFSFEQQRHPSRGHGQDFNQADERTFVLPTGAAKTASLARPAKSATVAVSSVSTSSPTADARNLRAWA